MDTDPKEDVESNRIEVDQVLLQNILKIMDVTISRGAFKGSEMVSVGSVYETINKLVIKNVGNGK